MFLYTIIRIFVSGLWQLFNMSIDSIITFDTIDLSLLNCAYTFFRKMLFSIHVSGLLAGNTISVTLILINDLCRSQGLHLIPFFHPFHITFILWIEWVFVVCLFSFDEIIITPVRQFVNTFFKYFLYKLSYFKLDCFISIYFIYF